MKNWQSHFHISLNDVCTYYIFQKVEALIEKGRNWTNDYWGYHAKSVNIGRKSIICPNWRNLLKGIENKTVRTILCSQSSLLSDALF